MHRSSSPPGPKTCAMVGRCPPVVPIFAGAAPSPPAPPRPRVASPAVSPTPYWRNSSSKGTYTRPSPASILFIGSEVPGLVFRFDRACLFTSPRRGIELRYHRLLAYLRVLPRGPRLVSTWALGLFRRNSLTLSGLQCY